MSIVFIDLEVNSKKRVVKYGAFVNRNLIYEGDSSGFKEFIKGYEYVCGHNAFMHDYKYIDKELKLAGIKKKIDTLPVSALLLAHPSHKLVKDYKISKIEENLPYIDASLTHDLLVEEVNTFKNLDNQLKSIYFNLLGSTKEFEWFFKYIEFKSKDRKLDKTIRARFKDLICENIDLKSIIKNKPQELAYCLAIINAKHLINYPPAWIVHQYPSFMDVLTILRGNPCFKCDYCNKQYDIHKFLKNTFKYDKYREFEGVPLQEEAVKAQIRGESIITVFPTAGGKSLTFQIPALIMAETIKGLTVVISPLQSLMQDQVYKLKEKNINNVGTINGSMNILERAETIRRLNSGEIHLLYIAPETLRSPSMFKMLSRRNIVRFVIDEAHCFSTWGHEFRVDYLYISEFINEVKKNLVNYREVPVSCFTATAKKEVIDDIKNYFKKNLNLDMKVITANTRRKNLKFFVHDCKDHKEKMDFIRNLLEFNQGKPVIIYTSRRKSTEQVAYELEKSGFPANYYHGDVKAELKNQYQLEFSKGVKNIIVATSAFGMGVDKDNVYFVIHYDVSATIEDYIQEAGRAGRDENINAECHILYNEDDVDKHFNLLTANKLSKNDINQVWKTIKRNTKTQDEISISHYELAKRSGFDIEGSFDSKTKISNSILALERANYIKRKQNDTKVYANNIFYKNMFEVRNKIDKLTEYSASDKEKMIRVMSTLFTDKNASLDLGSKPITSVDELSDIVEIEKNQLVRIIHILQDKQIINYDSDLIAKIPLGMNLSKSKNIINQYINIMKFIINEIVEEDRKTHIKEINTKIKTELCEANPSDITSCINFLDSNSIIHQEKDGFNQSYRRFKLLIEKEKAINIIENLSEVAHFITDYTYDLINKNEGSSVANYSVIEIKNKYISRNTLFKKELSIEETERAMLFLLKTGALIIDGGFLVIYLPMRIEKLEKNPNKQYTIEDYNAFMEYYNQKIKKIHILTEFVKELGNEYEKGMTLVDDYFSMPYDVFEKKYISKDYKKYFDKPITKSKYDLMFNGLSDKQKEIIEDKSEKNIVVLAGPGSGKTKVLAHKLASLIRLEDVKPYQLLMLTFSRSATVVFKKRLHDLIGDVANYVDIKTFHSFCFDVIGEVGNIDKSDSELFENAKKIIKENKFNTNIVEKTTLVIDEAQDMSEDEYELIQTLIEYNEKMRIIAVGDDDQNIFEFRGSSSKYLFELSKESVVYELITNYRSCKNLVEFTQDFSMLIEERLKKERCVSITDKEGNIKIFKHISNTFYEPIVNQVKLMTEQSKKRSIAVLTSTNEEAEIFYGLFTEAGINSQLIQSKSSFKLNELEQFRVFLGYFEEDALDISKDEWNDYVKSFKEELSEDPLLPQILKLLDDFNSLYPNKKYMNDLVEFMKESKMVDLYGAHSDIVTISTIHKSKGREFDTVFILQQDKEYNQADIRALYVGLTRAEKNIIIHTNSNLYDNIYETIDDENIYSEPNYLMIQMDLRDVNLRRCKYWEHVLENVSSGTNLDITDKGLSYEGKDALYFSEKMKEVICKKENNNYRLCDARVTFKVRWFNQSEERYYWIVLPLLKFKKVEKEEENVEDTYI